MTVNPSSGVALLDTTATRRQAGATTTRPGNRTAGKRRRSGVTGRVGPSPSAATTSSPRIRVRPIPDISPPVIDPLASVQGEVSPFVQGTLAITFGGNHGTSADPRDPESPAFFGPQRTFSSDLPEPRAWVSHMAQALIEVMSGARPAPQVIRWTTPEVYSALARRNAASARRPTVARRAIVRQVRICQPVDGVVEACAVIVDNDRVRALAMRLTGVDRRWVINALQVG